MNKKKMYANKPFDKALLPTTRKELFVDILKNHYFSLVKIGLLLALFMFPLLLIGIIKDYSYIIAASDGTNNASTIVISLLLEIPFVILLSVFASGVGKILREYAWMEPVFFKEDFKEGIRDNFKPTIISFIFIAVLNMVFEYIHYAFLNNGFIVAIPFGLNAFVLFPIIAIVLFINCLYSNPYGTNFKLGCFFYFKHLFSTIGLLLLLLLPRVFDLFHFSNILTLFIKYISLLFTLIFITPMVLIALQLNMMRIFDIHINAIRFPEFVNRGLYSSKDDEDESSTNDSK